MSDVVMIHDTDDINELEKERLAYDALDTDMKMLSDNESIRIYGKNNMIRYTELKAAIANGIHDEEPNQDVVGDLSGLKEDVDLEEDLGFFADYEEKCQKALQIELDTGLLLIYIPPWNAEEDDETTVLTALNMKYDSFNMQEESRKELSNGHAVSIFGTDNYNMYHKIKAKVLEDTFGKLNSIEADDLRSYRASISFEMAEHLYDFPYIEAKISDTLSTRDPFKVDFLRGVVEECFDNSFPEEIPEVVPNIFPEDIDNGILSPEDLADSPDPEFFENCRKGIFMNASCYKNLIEFYYSKLDSDKEFYTKRLLEFGWNPEVVPNKKNYEVARENMSLYMKSKFDKLKIVNLSRYTVEEAELVSEMSNFDPDIHPVFIVCCYTGSTVGKLIRRATDARYSHAAIGFDSDLNTLYSYNLNTAKKGGGLSFESIQKYVEDSEDADIFVGVTFLNNHDYKKMRSNVDWYIANYDKASYNILSLFSILLNRSKNIKYQLNLVCSQFVDNLFKLINIDLTDKSSSLVTPKDLSTVKDGSNVFILYQGLAKDYDSKAVDKVIYKLIKKVKRPVVDKDFKKILLSDNIKAIEESSEFYNELSVEPLQERMLPLKIDDTTITIDTPKDLENEYQKSHKLLVAYDHTDSMEPMKHELAKLWFLNIVIEHKLEKKSDTALVNLRSRILNDFKKYLAKILKEEKDFDFSKYYEDSPYADTNIKVDKNTTIELVSLIKTIITKV